jgi:membrane protease YdiL (CAAX protease family)
LPFVGKSLTLFDIVSTSKESTLVGGGLSTDNYAGLAHESGESPATVQVDPDNPPWGLMTALLVWVASVLLIALLPLIALIPYALYKSRDVGYDVFVRSLPEDKTAILISILTVIPVHLLTLALIWVVVTQFGKRPFWSTLGWSWGRNFGFWTSSGLAIALFFAGTAIISLVGGEPTDVDQIIKSSAAARYTTALLATATAPLVEELIYRGLIYSALQRAVDRLWTMIRLLLPLASAKAILLRAEGKLWGARCLSLLARLWATVNNILPPAVQNRMGMFWAVIIVSALFAFVHVFQYYNNFGVIAAIVLLSVSLTLVRAYTGRLLPCYIMHLIFNGVQALYIVLEPYIQKPDVSDEQKAAVVEMLTRAIHSFM